VVSLGTNRTGLCRSWMRKETCTCYTVRKCRRRSFKTGHGCPRRIYRTRKNAPTLPSRARGRSQ
jgi:hypothetical protein